MLHPLRRAPLVEVICKRLLEDHGEDDWLPPERELATGLGVSRPALREAIKRLEMQGRLVARHGVGVQVVDLPHAPVQAVLERMLPSPAERIRQFTVARRLIEPEVAALAAGQARATDRRELRTVHGRFMDEAMPVAATLEADLEFHRLIARVAGNRVLSLMIASMAPLEADSRRATLTRVGLATARRQHTAILEAILAGDSPRAHVAMLSHLDSALVALGNGR